MNDLTISEVKEIITGKFNDCIQALNEITIGEDSRSKKPMLNYPDQFHNYDQITGKLYGRNPKSPDMILFKGDTIIFVEFKSGKVKSSDVKLKAIEGCFIVLHKIVSTYREDINFIDIFKLKKSYILVYDKDRNARKGMYDHKYANKARFGLEMYRDTFFYSVKTWSKDKFVQWLQINRMIQGSNG
jgi:hypothetical protein